MDTDDTARPGRGRWTAAVLANLLAGCLGVPALFVLLLFVRSYPLAWLGLGSRDPNDNDGILPWILLLGLLITAFLSVWVLVNLLVARLTGLGGRRFWWTGAALCLVPTALLALYDAL
ncbi:hypothetical protein [Kitasatospora sp. DSM 101779]|uniref:hypothetical protein n=1 Tax=Kitasatospora sp. DSM 101779 TaxID=2853165 RepID=UPI0021D9F5B9|nr:hypothetical protein [Kitasatospora sp. DSM 101779]MCU7822078.1 hypothetical protein [Kitasatospora sp. DSM 101779]